MLAIIAAAIIGAQGTANAGLVAQNDTALPVSPDGTNVAYDDVTGWHWLDVNVTRGQSYSAVLGRLSTDLLGFRFATVPEVYALMSHSSPSINHGWLLRDASAMFNFVSQVGGPYSSTVYAFAIPDPINSSFLGVVDSVRAERSRVNSNYYDHVYTFSDDAGHYHTAEDTHYYVGSWLVDTHAPASPVPEPSSLLIATSLFVVFGLAGVRRRLRRQLQPVTELG